MLKNSLNIVTIFLFREKNNIDPVNSKLPNPKPDIIGSDDSESILGLLSKTLLVGLRVMMEDPGK